MKLTLKNKVLAAIAGLFVVALLVATAVHADGATLYVAQTAPTTIEGALGAETNPYTSMQAAIDAAQPGDTINVAAGTYSASQFLVLAAKSGITIHGAGTDLSTGTVFQLTAQSDGFKVQANDVTLENFTITNTPTPIANYGLRAQGVSNLTVHNVTISNMKKSGFDINGVSGSHFSGLSAQNNGGNGIAISDSKNLAFTGVTTLGNGWGGVALYATGASTYACGVDSISFDSNSSFNETGAVYTGIDNPANPACTITNITLPNSVLPYKVTLAKGSRAQIDPQDIYVKSIADASLVASTPAIGGTPAYSALNPVLHSTVNNGALVATGFSLQNAINAASANDTITFASNITTTAEVIITKAIT
ncbi:MAG: hypothetical protein JWL92_371, partial [Candidatus Nomurabacteria bacterium]|nr:hypothetical protein [Candidatus Nomurabacteria bacterium]